MGVERGGERRWMGSYGMRKVKQSEGRIKTKKMEGRKIKRTKGKAKYGEMKPRKEDSRLP
jgi:hypothetical protein